MNSDLTDSASQDDGPAIAAKRDLVDTIALEAVTATPLPRPAPEATTPYAGEIGGFGGTEADGEADAMIGQRLGAYQLIARIGSGGMGNVYLAARVEDTDQRFAVKLIKGGMDSETAVRRFHDEINVQSAFGTNSDIAGLLDAGTAPDGRLYYVVEYVDGQRIDEYCDNRRLDVPARLLLFERVLGAVDFAHRHGVIHRDLKPGNILVTGDGVPKLIDFGIANLMGPGSAGAQPAGGLARTGESVMTPAYASPEQIQGQPVTTAVDIYALGVVFYQLLTGRWPYRLKSHTTSDIFQAICEQAPERPSMAVVRRPASKASAAPSHLPSGSTASSSIPASSNESPPALPPASESAWCATEPGPDEIAAARRATPRGLEQLLAGDLDMIVLMALRKEPERRHASAVVLADDLRRHLDGRPVSARSDSTIYCVGRFVRCHARAVAAAVAVALALVAAVAGTTTGLVLARRERDRARLSSRQARQAVDQFFTRVSEERLLNQPGLHPLRKELLQDAEGFYKRFLAAHAQDPARSADLASARSRLARITAEIGSPVEAALAFQQAVALWDDLLRSNPGEPGYQESLARTLSDQAALLMPQDGRRDDALEACRRARALLEPLAAAPTAPAQARSELAFVLQNMVAIQVEKGQPGEAFEILERVLEIQGQLAARDAGALDPRIALAKAHHQMGQILSEQPDGMAQALLSCQQGVDIRESISREHPELADQAYSLALDLGDQAILQQMDGKLDSALASLRRAVEVLERLDRKYPGVLNYQRGLASTYNLMSDLYRRRLESADSLAWAEKGRSLLERLVGEHPNEVEARTDLARSYNNIGRVHQQSGETSEALRAYQRAVDLYEGLPELGPRNCCNLACNLALSIPLIGAKHGSTGELDPDAVPPGDRVRRQVYGDRAIDVIRRAVRGGFRDTEILQTDPDLAAIRGRDDFQEIVKEAGKQTAAGVK
jgi:serine/threonine protein kinase/tetratricopeptide (TPR) repeat protein